MLLPRRSRSQIYAVSTLLLLLAVHATAHVPVPPHDCRAPIRPPEGVDEAVWNRFVDEVDTYRACISRFVEQNNAAAEGHRLAANAATMSWNTFVRDSLNVPQDFPWPEK